MPAGATVSEPLEGRGTVALRVFLLSGRNAMDSPYLSMTEAARRIGTSRIVLRRRVNREGISVFTDPLDDRRRLVRVADVDRLRQPQPIRPEAAALDGAA